MSWASRHSFSGGAPLRIQANTPASSAYTPTLAGAGGRGIFERRVRGGPGQVQPGAGHLRLQPGQQPKALRVALEATAAGGERGQRRLPVVPERGVTPIVGQARGVDPTGLAP